MGVRKHGHKYVGTHITGPTHNFLALRLVRGDPRRSFPVIVLPSQGGCCHHEGLTADEMVPMIREGLDHANEALGTTFAIESAEIVENDSRYPAAYRILTAKIVQQAADDERVEVSDT